MWFNLICQSNSMAHLILYHRLKRSCSSHCSPHNVKCYIRLPMINTRCQCWELYRENWKSEPVLCIGMVIVLALFSYTNIQNNSCKDGKYKGNRYICRHLKYPRKMININRWIRGSFSWCAGCIDDYDCANYYHRATPLMSSTYKATGIEIY